MEAGVLMDLTRPARLLVEVDRDIKQELVTIRHQKVEVTHAQEVIPQAQLVTLMPAQQLHKLQLQVREQLLANCRQLGLVFDR